MANEQLDRIGPLAKPVLGRQEACQVLGNEIQTTFEFDSDFVCLDRVGMAGFGMEILKFACGKRRFTIFVMEDAPSAPIKRRGV